MDSLLPDFFFDTSSFSHAELFSGCHYVWEAIDRLHDYLMSQTLGEIRGEVSPDAHLIHPELISIGEGSVVEPGAYIKGPCLIGQGCEVRHGAYIRGDLLAGDKVVIGHATEVKNSLFLNGAKAGHFAYVADSLIGNGVNLGAGCRLANFRLDERPIAIRYQGQRIETGRRKFGAIVGDRSSLGCNCVANPGTLLGKEVQSYPCTNFGGVIAPHSVISHQLPR